MTKTSALIRDVLEETARKSGVPGASLAVRYGSQTYRAVFGKANAPAGLDVTPDTAFFVGSITKSLTATVAMQQVEGGRLSLDSKLSDVLPELRLSDQQAAQQITVRHLLNHTSGLDGDQLFESSSGDDYLEKFVEGCSGIDVLHQAGAMFSYCNAGYNFLGRILEKATNKVWDDLLSEQILKPLGLTNSAIRLEDLVGRRVAIGHTKSADEPMTSAGPADNSSHDWMLEPLSVRSNSASGSRLVMTPSDLVAFAYAHLNGGRSESGEKLLSSASVAAMQNREIEIPEGIRYRAWGLGWMHFDWGGETVFGHDGGVQGTSSFLRILPEHELLIALAINGPDANTLYRQTMGVLLSELAGISAIPEVPPPDLELCQSLDPTRYVGCYARNGLEAEILLDGTELKVKVGGDYYYSDTQAAELLPATRDIFVARPAELGVDVTLAFSGYDDLGHPQFLHFMERVYPRKYPRGHTS